jgi:hypothetical protein
MKSRPAATEINTGSVAKDFIKSVKGQKCPVLTHTGQDVLRVHEILGAFEDHNKPSYDEPVVPVKTLVKVLTHGMQGMPGLLVYGDGKEIGARLFRGCPVRLIGIPERTFFVDDIFWDREEVRVREVGSDTEYVMPYACVEFYDE